MKLFTRKLSHGIAAIIVMFALSGCSDFYDRLVTPKPWGMAETPDGTPTFKKGWEEGCESGLSAYGNDRYKLAYSYKQDPNLILNREYYRAWKDAYTYCRWYAWNWVRPARR